MSVPKALRDGVVELNRSRRLALVFYAAATLPAIVGAAVVMTVPLGSLGQSTWAEAMGGSLDLSWIAELGAQSTLPGLPIVASVVGVFCLARLLHLFLLGGALQVFATGRPYAAEFFSGCGRNFWRLARLGLFSLPFFSIAFAIHAGLDMAGNKLWGEGNEATPLVHWSWFSYAMLAILLGLCSLAHDYGAIRLVTEDSRRAVRAYLGAFRLIWRAPLRTLGLYAAVWLIGLLLLGAYLGVAGSLPQTGMALVLLLFVVRQCAVVVKVWWRLLFYSSECALYADLRPPAPTKPEIPLERSRPIEEEAIEAPRVSSSPAEVLPES